VATPKGLKVKNRLLLNLGLLALVCALGWFAWNRSTAVKTDDRPKFKLSTLNVAQVSSISLRKPGNAEILVEKKGENWRLLQPIAGRAERNAVERMLDIAGATSLSKIDASDLKQFGLDLPLATLRLGEQVFRFGATNSITFEQYVATADGVYPVSTHYGSALPNDASRLLSRMILNDGEIPVGFDFPGLKLLREKDSGKWQASGARKPSEETSQDDFNRFADGWRFASALSAQPQRVSKEQARWRISLQDGRVVDFAVTQQQSELVLARLDEKTEFHFQNDMLNKLSALPAADKKPLTAVDKPLTK